MINISQLPDTLSHWIEIFSPWITQYGSISLFFLLALGIIALPIPDEWLLVSAGFLIAKGVLNVFATTLASVMGAWCGISVSYLLGIYLGPYIFSSRIGSLLGLQNKRLKAQHWFHKIGKWSLVVGYFIPGVRHFVGYIAGSLNFPYPQFALYAYTGGAVWSTLFLTIGYNIHQNGPFIIQSLEHVQSLGIKYLLFFVGFLVQYPTLITLTVGALGVTASYILGLYTGPYLIENKTIRVRFADYSKQSSIWFHKLGNWVLVIGSFIPGIRYLISYLAGTFGFSYRKFAIYAYVGVAVWALILFISGYGTYPKNFLVIKILQYLRTIFLKIS